MNEHPMTEEKNECFTDGLDGVGAGVPGHGWHKRAQIIGSRLQTHPVHCGRTDNQHFCDTARELWPVITK